MNVGKKPIRIKNFVTLCRNDDVKITTKSLREQPKAKLGNKWQYDVLSHCERLMLASRRAKKRVDTLKRMRLRSDVAVGQHIDYHCSVCLYPTTVITLQVNETSA